MSLRKAKLPEVVFFQEGPGVRKFQFRQSGIKLLNGGNINDNKIDLSTTSIFLDEKEVNERYKHFLVDAGDLLIASSGVVVDNFHKKIAFADKEHLPLCMNTSTIRFKSLDERVLSINYFKFFLQSKKFTSQLRKLITGSAQLNFGPSHLKQIDIQFPPLDDQIHIANILSKAESLIAQRKESLRLLDEFLKSTFLEMFGDPVRNEKGWEKVLLGSHVDVLTGYPFKSKDYLEDDQGIKLCGGLIIQPDRIAWEQANQWSRKKTNGLERYFLKEHDIVIAMDRPWISTGFKIRMIMKSELPTLLVQRTARLRSEDFNHHYLFFLINHRAFEIHSKPTETTVPHISSSDIKSFKVPMPPLRLQTQFAHIVEKTEALKVHYQTSLQELENLYGSLSQSAFKGELKVKREKLSMAGEGKVAYNRINKI
ncbi:MAG: restriction endonuclease subunit S [Cyclobacteriaceae bacterium]|nr:restriction endonuclease subunit S [Cyclobacteriaceae bacterium]